MYEKWTPHPTLDGVATRLIDGEGGLIHRQKVQDVAPILSQNAALRNHDDGYNATRTRRRIGRIPATVYYDWIVEFQRKGLIGPGNMEPLNDLIVARLRDSDYSKFRTSDGAI